MNTYYHSPCPKCGQKDMRNYFYLIGEKYRVFTDFTKAKEYTLENIIHRICRNCFLQRNGKPLNVPERVHQ